MKVSWRGWMTVLRSNGHSVGFRRQVRVTMQDVHRYHRYAHMPANLWSSGDVLTTEELTRNGVQEPMWRD